MRREDWLLAWVMGSVHFAFHFFMRVVPPLIPLLALELGLPLWKLGLLLTLFFAGSSVGLLPAGVWSDAYDRRVTLTAGIALVSLAYLVFALAPTFGAVLPAVSVGRYTASGTMLVMNTAMFVAGLGASVHIPVGVPIITTNSHEENKGKLLGIWGGASKLGDAATPALIGVLIVAFAWDDIVLAFGVAGLVYTAALFAVLSLDRFETVPAGDTDGGHGDADGYWRTDRRAYIYPILVLILYFAGYQITVQGVVTFTPTFVADIYGYGFTLGGVSFGAESFADFALSTMLIAGAVSRFGAGMLVDRYDHRLVLIGSLGLATGGLFVFTFLPLGPLEILVVLAVFGGALWGNSPARDTLISDMSPAEREGRTFSYLWTASRVFGALSPVLIGFLADTAGIRQGFGYLTGAVFLSALAVSLLFSERVYVNAAEGDDRAA